MTTLREAAQQALEAMENSRVFVTTQEKIKHPEGTEWYDERITALRAVLAQQAEPKGGGNLPPPLQAEPVQEPVAPYAWMAVGGTIWRRKTSEDDVPLYTRPPRREWQSLSEEDMEDLLPLYSDPSANTEMLEFAAAIEVKLKEKNA